ncbi:MFS transporter [Magnetospirillum fulvum]|uniref:MFS transporter, PPP family, 3-phenylpropionic acid transporter n=1 Tax=Magnetospirillum fulvum TaxID=1082 RepID=A0A1H6JCW3_MAGFU|nr:MFS transporter [Magnetospirillum fulvum]SEH60043.1 MFS transporter, PPP family, 3-phenylpropionic acid transporter [Magnetospirillum fulvum]
MNGAGQATRLATYYAALFAIIGILAPFWPLWLSSRGLSPSEIGILIAFTYLTRLVANPLVGHWVDHRGDRKRPMLILAAAAAALCLLFPLAWGFWPILIVTLLVFLPFNGLMPVGDSLVLMVAAREKLDYGRVRLWGSLAFIATASTVGHVLEVWPADTLAWMFFALLLGLTLTCTALPDARVPLRERPPPLRPLLGSGLFLLFLAATALNQTAHTVYYGFATLHWKAAGLSDATIGLLWSEGVVAEIVLFSLSGRAVALVGPAGLILTAGLCGIVRWTVLGATTEPALLALAQLLHAATFGCAHLGAMHFIQRAVPPSLSVRAQGLFAAISVGLAPGLVIAATGPLYEWLGGEAFWVMAALSAASALTAWPLLRRWRGGRLIAA